MKVRAMLSAIAMAVILVGVSATSASAAVAPVGVSLGLAGFGDVVLDEGHGKLFVSGGLSGNSVAVASTLTAGVLPAMVNNLPGSSGMVLSADGTRLFVALAAGDGIAVLDTSNNTEVARFSTGARTCPTDIARTGAQVWFSYGCPGALSGKIGLLDPSKPAATAITFDVQGSVKFARAPMLASNGSGALVAAQPVISLTNMVVFTPSTGALTVSATDNAAGGNLTDLAVSPDGKTIYTAFGSRDRAEAFSTTDLSAQGVYSARPHPDAVASNPQGTYLAVGALTGDSNDIRVYKPGTTTPVTTQTLGAGDVVAPRGLAFSSTLDTVYAIVQHDGQPAPSLVTIPLAATV